jgi:predicted N-acetyltransferase YhbS
MPTTTELHFRFADEKDIPALESMINAAFAIERFMEGTRTDAARLAADLRKGRILVAEQQPVTLVACLYMEPRGERGYLGMLAVAPTHQRQGLAHRLTQEAENRLRSLGCRAADISVLSQRTELPPIYRRWGFQQTGSEPFAQARELKEGVQCYEIHMSKPL